MGQRANVHRRGVHRIARPVRSPASRGRPLPPDPQRLPLSPPSRTNLLFASIPKPSVLQKTQQATLFCIDSMFLFLNCQRCELILATLYDSPQNAVGTEAAHRAAFIN